MLTDVKNAWVAALRSGDYMQWEFKGNPRIRRALMNSFVASDDTQWYSARGVLCEVLINEFNFDIQKTFIRGHGVWKHSVLYDKDPVGPSRRICKEILFPADRNPRIVVDGLCNTTLTDVECDKYDFKMMSMLIECGIRSFDV